MTTVKPSEHNAAFLVERFKPIVSVFGRPKKRVEFRINFCQLFAQFFRFLRFMTGVLELAQLENELTNSPKFYIPIQKILTLNL